LRIDIEVISKWFVAIRECSCGDEENYNSSIAFVNSTPLRCGGWLVSLVRRFRNVRGRVSEFLVFEDIEAVIL
jgi:hypothetical protein